MNKEMEDWVLIEAAKRSEYDVNAVTLLYKAGGAFRALCEMILKHEQPPVDRKLLCAREAEKLWSSDAVKGVDDACLRAIELWEEGFGK